MCPYRNLPSHPSYLLAALAGFVAFFRCRLDHGELFVDIAAAAKMLQSWQWGLPVELAGLAEQERQTVAVAQRLDPPGPLRPEHENLIEALQLRVNGIQGLADAFRRTAGSKASSDAALLAAPAQRLLASDVMWDDLFLAPATGCSSPSSGRLVSCSSVEFPDLPGGTGQVGVIHQRRRIPLFGL